MTIRCKTNIGKKSRGKKKLTSSMGIPRLISWANANGSYVFWCLPCAYMPLYWNLVNEWKATLVACFSCLWAIVSAANWIIKVLCFKDDVNWGVTAVLQMAYKNVHEIRKQFLEMLAHHPPNPSYSMAFFSFSFWTCLWRVYYPNICD